MKNTLIQRLAALLPVALLAALPASASVTVSVDAGLLTSNTGADLTDGNLVLLIASTSSGIFAPITAGSFVSGDNIIVGAASVTGAFAMADQNSGTTGETFNTLTFNYGLGSTNSSVPVASTFAPGDKLALRWFDDFTLTQFLAGDTPTQGYYGTYTTLGSSAPDGGLGWVAPADGVTLTGADGLNFFTTNDPLGGSQAPVEGMALTPLVGAPEPSTFALLGAGALLLAALRRRLAGEIKI